jgi:hypothetical protein
VTGCEEGDLHCKQTTRPCTLTDNALLIDDFQILPIILIAIPTPALLLEYITIWDDRTPDHMPHVLVECRNENNENEGVHQESGVSCRMCGIFERLDDREGGLFF